MSNPKAMNRIKTWRERCNEHPDHNGIVSDGMIMALMQEEIGELRAALKKARWVELTDKEVKPPIQRAMQHFGFDPTQYSLSGAATIGFLSLVRAIEAKLKEKNA